MNNETRNDQIITFGNLTLEGRTGIPTLEIKCGNSPYYLQPFRAYRFQVSGSKDGDGDYGSSPVLHFRENFKGMHYALTTGIIDSAARDAIYRFCDGRGMVPSIGVLTHIYYEFIDECHKWLFGTKSNYLVFDEDRVVKDNRKDGRMIIS